MLQALFILFKINMYVWNDNFKQKLTLKNIFHLLRSRVLKGEVSFGNPNSNSSFSMFPQPVIQNISNIVNIIIDNRGQFVTSFRQHGSKYSVAVYVVLKWLNENFTITFLVQLPSSLKCKREDQTDYVIDSKHLQGNPYSTTFYVPSVRLSHFIES